ncbi:hypothetical protein ACFQ3R_05005 [Mesonia ostreae]|uniref:Uncharacterized protein n=1 Tax=Mesonia ostreae TaxID=861110 RepID=A0ABU2KKA8_9FLAO|nr:hypothetical protein [Mesonia ostreae]MDT0295172.1 hypothetical protein [Mesonia ostreae]
MQYSSFEKGELFENFVVDKLFKASEYDLIHRTNSFNQNESRYAENTLKPDFKFRCKTTQQEFYVEAKFRSGFNSKEMIEAISYNQIERFKTFQKKEKIPIYIVIGYGGIPNNPESLSLIPLDDLSYLELYVSFLRRFKIDKGLVKSNLLNLPKKQHKEESKTSLEDDQIKEKVTGFNKGSLFNFKNKKVLLASGIGLLLMVFLFFNTFITSTEDTLKQKTTEYYNTIESGNINALENYIEPNVVKWYSKSNMSFADIKKDTKAYVKRHPATKVEIQWDTFNVNPLNNDYAVTYNMVYKLLKENRGKDIIYHLKIHAIWSEDLKIKSLYEERI